MKHAIRWIMLPFLAVFLLGTNVAGADDSGKKIFKKRCSQCHALPDPAALTSEEWIQRLDMMAPMAGLKKNQKHEVLEYLQDHSKKATTLVTMSAEKQLFEEKCTLCHGTGRLFVMPLTKESRRHIVLRMQQRAPGWISPKEADEILKYLEAGAPGAEKPKRRAITGGPPEVFRERCSVCHQLDRIFYEFEEHRFKAGGWMHIVNRMRDKAPDWMSKKEAKEIMTYLNSIKPVKKPVPKE